MSRRSLVTGGGGFVGRHLVRLLLERGEAVRVLDIADVAGLAGDVEILRGSILDADAVAGALKGVDRLYHLAGNPNLWSRRPLCFLETNFHGTQTVLAAAAGADLERIVYTSTESILKSRRGRSLTAVDESVRWTVEDMPGPYCRSKFLAEEAAKAAAARGLPVVIVNPTMPIGPGDVHLTPPSRMLLGFLNGETPAYLDCEFNLVDVRDVAVGHILAADKGEIGERYILGRTNIRMSALLDLLARLTGLAMPRLKVPYGLALAAAVVGEGMARLTGRPPIAPLAGVRLARTPMLFDSSRAVRVLGLPQTPLERSLADAVGWFKEQRLLRRNPLKEIA
ncbi:MAG TPA: NAD-dependent epimerase/dehydratase family protein [Dongiaceae bacterium]|nr:NAD-dependent epimerase/dehydratase family protein [Dongiaceae bacterium]